MLFAALAPAPREDCGGGEGVSAFIGFEEMGLSVATPESEETAAIPRHPPGYRFRRFQNWFFLGLLYAGYYLCRYNLGIVTPELKQEFGWNEDQLGAMSSGRDAGYAVGQFVNGLFADGIGGKQAM